MEQKTFNFERLDNETVMINGVKYKAVEETKPEIPIPKTWAEFCENYKYTGEECFIGSDSEIHSINKVVPHRVNRNAKIDKNTYTDLSNAEAILALAQLIQLRDCYNRGWQPDWSSVQTDKYVIDLFCNKMKSNHTIHCGSILYFKTAKLRDLFLENFRGLIEKLKPLYGIMKGGEE